MSKQSLCHILAMMSYQFVIVRSHSEHIRRTDMTNASSTMTVARPLPEVAADRALTLDQLVAPLDIPAELSAARWAPKWTLTLPITLLAAFTLAAHPA
jgi:hypothetical protein